MLVDEQMKNYHLLHTNKWNSIKITLNPKTSWIPTQYWTDRDTAGAKRKEYESLLRFLIEQGI